MRGINIAAIIGSQQFVLGDKVRVIYKNIFLGATDEEGKITRICTKKMRGTELLEIKVGEVSIYQHEIVSIEKII